MAQAVFKSWFVDFEPWGGVMPDDWQEADFSTFLTPRAEKSNDPSIPLFSVTDTGIHLRDEKFYKRVYCGVYDCRTDVRRSCWRCPCTKQR